MKSLLFFGICVAYLFLPTVEANPCGGGACLELKLGCNGWSGSCPKPGQPSTEYVTVNGQRLEMLSKDFLNGRRDWIMNRSVDSRTLFHEGVNTFNFQLGSVFEGTNTPAACSYELHYWNSFSRRQLICAGGFTGGIGQFIPCAHVSMILNDIDPNLAAEIEACKRDIQSHAIRAHQPTPDQLRFEEDERKLNRERQEIESKLNLLNQELAQINFGDFDSIQIDQMAQLISEDATIRQTYNELKTSVNGLKANIQQEVENNVTQTHLSEESLRDLFGEAVCHQNPFIPEAMPLRTEGPFTHGTPSFSADSANGAQSAEPVSQVVEGILSHLEHSLNQGDQAQFLATFSGWNLYQQRVKTLLEKNQSSLGEFDLLRRAQARVLQFFDDLC